MIPLKIYYLDLQSKPVGPITLEEFAVIRQSGVIAQDPLVIGEGQKEWQKWSVFQSNLEPTGSVVATTLPVVPVSPQPVGTPGSAPNPSLELVKRAWEDALRGLKILAPNPTANWASALNLLDNQRALGAGVIYGLIFAVTLTLAFYRLSQAYFYESPHGVGVFLRVTLLSAVPFLAFFGTTFCGRKILGGKGTAGHDLFVVGIACLPLSVVALAAAALGYANFEVITALGAIASVFTVLLLFSALIRVAALAEIKAFIAVPLIIMISGYISKIAYASTF